MTFLEYLIKTVNDEEKGLDYLVRLGVTIRTNCESHYPRLDPEKCYRDVAFTDLMDGIQQVSN